MSNVLCLSESHEDVSKFISNANLLLFQIEQLEPEDHSFLFFYEIYQKLKDSTDLSKIDLIIAEYIESIPLVYFMRKDGYYCPSVFIPHTNPYPFNILFYFLSVSELFHPLDRILCGSTQAAKGYEHLTGIKSLPICTFGIKDIHQKGDKAVARKELGLPVDKKILLYTGRFMNDKGLMPLFEIYRKLKMQMKDVLLVLSVTHIDPYYYNACASKMEGVILFYRLEKERVKLLYQSADLFTSAATSVFETYGKSPLEAITSGIPAILPHWDGFSYFINENNGALAKVNYDGPVEEAPYSFASVDIDDFVDKCLSWLKKEVSFVDSKLPEWAYYHETMKTLPVLIKQLLGVNNRFHKENNSDDEILLSKYPKIVEKICSYYEIRSLNDLEVKAEALGLISREAPGNMELLRELHDELFIKMEKTPNSIFDKNCNNTMLELAQVDK